MYWHIETDCVCLIIMFVLYFDIHKRSFSTLYQDQVFRFITLATMYITAIDIIASIVMEYCSIWWLYQTVMIVYYCSVLILPFLWFYYVMVVIHPKFSKKERILVDICFALMCLYILMCLSNPLSGLIFSLTPDMVYTRGPLFAVGTLLLAFYCVVALIVVIIYRKSIVPRSRAWILVSFFFIVAAALYIQLSVPGLLLMNAAYTIVFVMTYYYIQNRRTIVDGLTGIYNRNTGEQRVYDYINSYSRGKGAAFVITDIDNFKTVNDTMGHHLGDLVLKAVSETFVEVFPHDAIMARLGGDEFMILIDKYGSREELEEVLARVNSTLQEKLNLNIPSGMRQITVSMGISMFPEQGKSFVELYENADIALYQAKWSGKNRYVFFNPEGELQSFNQLAATDESHTIDIDDITQRMSTEPRVKTALIINGDPADQDVLSKTYRDEYIILHAEDTDAALRLLNRYGTTIIVILLDLELSQKNSYDFLCEKNRNPAIKSIPALAITSSDDLADKEKALQYGVADLVQKPINPEILMLKTENLLAKYSMGFWYNDIYQRELLNLANLGIRGGVFCVCRDSPDYTIDYISYSLLKLLGYSNLQEMLTAVNGQWRNCMLFEDYRRVAPLIEKRFSQGGEYTVLEYRLMRKDGSTVWICDNGKLMISREGIEYIIGICVDISMTKQN